MAGDRVPALSMKIVIQGPVMNIHYNVPQNPILTIIRAQGPLVVFSFKGFGRGD